MQKLFQFVELVFALAAALLGVAVAVLILRILKIPDPAAWVQAVGSIGAIIGAFTIANYQFRIAMVRDRERDNVLERRTILNILAIASQANDLVEGARAFRVTEFSGNEMPDGPEYRQKEILRLNDMFSVLTSIGLHELGNVNIVNEIVSLRRIIATTIGEIESLDGWIACGQDRFLEPFDDLARLANASTVRINEEYQQCIAEQNL